MFEAHFTSDNIELVHIHALKVSDQGDLPLSWRRRNILF
jgi:hypothetical protein